MLSPTPDTPFLASLQEAYRQLTRPGDRLLLAVSGGRDSTALAHASAQLAESIGLRFAVACVDHGLREGSRAELEAVRRLAHGLGLPFEGVRVEVGGAGNLEARARAARYAALEGLRAAGNHTWVATAHTASDQAETLLMRLVRGAALRGAGSIRAARGRVLRPLLGLTRKDVDGYLSAHRLTALEDPMNRDPRFLRTRVREQALPVLRALGGEGTEQRLARFARYAAEDEAYLDAEAARALARVQRGPGNLDAAAVLALAPPIRRRALRAWLEERGASLDVALLGRVEDAIRRRGRCPLPGGHSLACEGGLVRRPGPMEPPGPSSVALGPEVPVEFGPWRLSRRTASAGADALAFPMPPDVALRVRARRPGDRVEAGGRRPKVQDLFVNAKVPREARADWPLVCDAATDRPVWLVGLFPSVPAAVEGPCVCAERVRL